MKKVILTMALVMTLSLAGAITAFASVITKDINLAQDYKDCVDNAFSIFYYTYPIYDTCCAYSELSVSSDMRAYVYTRVTGPDGMPKVTSSTTISDGLVKTKPAYIEYQCAQEVYYKGQRSLNGQNLGIWEYYLK